jgi:hypothetical protein
MRRIAQSRYTTNLQWVQILPDGRRPARIPPPVALTGNEGIDLWRTSR